VKTLFIFPNFNASYCWSPAIQILSAVLKRAGHESFLIHINDQHAFPNDTKRIVDEVRKIKPDLIGFTGTTFDFARLNELCREMKRVVNCPVILGGIHATIKPDDLKDSNFDAFCIGEGEKPLLELANRLKDKKDYLDVGSFWFKDKDKIIKNNTLGIVEDLNELPFNDWEIMNTKDLLLKRDNRLSIMISRGCPFHCSFCINQVLKKIKGLKNFTRLRSVDNAMAELKYLANNFKIDTFHFDDDMFLVNRAWLADFTKRYKTEIYEKYNIPYTIEARVDAMDEDAVKTLKESGCYEVRFGIETGDENLRNMVLNKRLNNEKIIEVFDLCNKHDLKPSAFFMFGIPHETEESLIKTTEMIAKIRPYLVRPTFFVPIVGTPLYEYCQKNKLMKEKGPENQFSESALIFEDLSEDVLFRYYTLLPWYVNLKAGHKHYLSAIEKAEKCTSDELKSMRSELLAEDKRLSERTKSSHHTYFGSNAGYIQRVDPEKNKSSLLIKENDMKNKEDNMNVT
jgi:anaerobic magnesium-protoporphyrin IX monomethyl ester cyclase